METSKAKKNWKQLFQQNTNYIWKTVFQFGNQNTCLCIKNICCYRNQCMWHIMAEIEIMR